MDAGVYRLLDCNHDDKSFNSQLANINEDIPTVFSSPGSYPEPEIPEEPLEFLSRSWSLAVVGKGNSSPLPKEATDNAIVHVEGGLGKVEGHTRGSEQELESPPFTFASTLTSQIVMERILQPTELSIFHPRRKSHSSGPLVYHHSGPLAASPPVSPMENDDIQCYRSIMATRIPFRGRSILRWLKDLRDQRKEVFRLHSAQLHAAMSVAGVAAAVAAIAAATAGSATDSAGTRTSMAVASAASLVAAQCVEVAENMGVDRDQLSSIVSSAVNVKTAGDVMTLTAAAATAIRGATTFKARTSKETWSYATVTPYEIAPISSSGFSGELASEDSEAEYYTQELLARGCEFLKRSKRGDLNWKMVYVYMDKQGQVIVKLQRKFLHGAVKTNKKSVLLELHSDIPAWPGRNLLDNSEQRRYFGLKTSSGMQEFECKNIYQHNLWTQGIAHLLILSARRER